MADVLPLREIVAASLALFAALLIRKQLPDGGGLETAVLNLALFAAGFALLLPFCWACG